ncbi:hypothetical protein F-VV10_0187 [Faustovirus]|nr:hypothetical protein F-VV10_0187 [Faustovirus]
MQMQPPNHTVNYSINNMNWHISNSFRPNDDVVNRPVIHNMGLNWIHSGYTLENINARSTNFRYIRITAVSTLSVYDVDGANFQVTLAPGIWHIDHITNLFNNMGFVMTANDDAIVIALRNGKRFSLSPESTLQNTFGFINNGLDEHDRLWIDISQFNFYRPMTLNIQIIFYDHDGEINRFDQAFDVECSSQGFNNSNIFGPGDNINIFRPNDNYYKFTGNSQFRTNWINYTYQDRTATRISVELLDANLNIPLANVPWDIFFDIRQN